NAATLINEDFRDTEDTGGVFSGFTAEQGHPERGKYTPYTWRYDTPDSSGSPATGEARSPRETTDAQHLVGPNARTDLTLHNPPCVLQILKKHFQQYTPEKVEEVCGTPSEVFERVVRTLLDNAGPDRSGAICYAVGWTQHTTGVQMIRAAAILQLLLGN